VTGLSTIIIIYIAAALCVGVILGYLANRDGGSFVKWFLYGAILPFIALPKAMSILKGVASTGGGGVEGYKKCGYCRKKVKFGETHCPKCGYEFIDWG